MLLFCIVHVGVGVNTVYINSYNHPLLYITVYIYIVNLTVVINGIEYILTFHIQKGHDGACKEGNDGGNIDPLFVVRIFFCLGLNIIFVYCNETQVKYEIST